MHKTQRERESGFSLVELLAVVVIIGIIAGIAVPRFSSAKNRANLARAVSDGGAILLELNSMLTGYTSVGTTSNGTIAIGTISASRAQLNLTLGSGYAPSSQAANQFTSINVSSSTETVAGSLATGATSLSFCFIVTVEGQSAVFNEISYQPSATNCANGVAS